MGAASGIPSRGSLSLATENSFLVSIMLLPRMPGGSYGGDSTGEPQGGESVEGAQFPTRVQTAFRLASSAASTSQSVTNESIACRSADSLSGGTASPCVIDGG